MRVLIAVISFRYLTGAELYVYELARSLTRRGHDVTVVGQAGGLIAERARACGIAVHDFQTMPRGLSFDVLHVQELAPARWAMARHPDTPVVATVHSQWPCETPLVDPRIHKYVCIRPEVRDKVLAEDGIPHERTAVVYNGVDFARFSPASAPPGARESVLFAGTVDPLRREAALHLIDRAVAEDFDVTFIGTRHSSHLDGPLPPNVSWLQGDIWEIERHVQACTATAGIVLGRTTIEGWACGKPGWIYDVDLAGRIRDVTLHPPPHEDILAQFESGYMAAEMESLYTEAIGARGSTPRAPQTGVSTTLAPEALDRLGALRPRTVALDLADDRWALLAFADELAVRPELFAAWARHFAGDPQASLVVYAKGEDEVVWGERLQEMLDRTGLAPEEQGDVLLVLAAPGESLNGVGNRLAGVLTDATHVPPALDGLPVVSGEGMAALSAATLAA